MINKSKNGSILLITLVVTGIFFMILSSAISLGLMQQKFNKVKIASTQALHISEAGINYYKWVMYHNNGQFCNVGETECSYGPYNYVDVNGNAIGQYELFITPPSSENSNIVKIKSVAFVNEYPNVKRTIEVQYGQSSFASYMVLSDAALKFGEETEIGEEGQEMVIEGKVHSNGGIRFDGIAYNVISSSVLSYKDPSHSNYPNDPAEFGVHTHIDPIDPLPDGTNPPNNVPDRSVDVFRAGRKFPVPVIDFGLLDAYIADMYELATDEGLVFPYSGEKGYYIEFKPGTPRVNVSVVRCITNQCCFDSTCLDTYGIVEHPTNNCKMIDLGQYEIPSNGVIFVQDNVWIDASPEAMGTRATIIAYNAEHPSDIIIRDATSYKYDETSIIGLIAQRNIRLPLDIPDDLGVDATMIAKDGSIGREYYPTDCGSQASRNQLIIYGSLITKQGYGFARIGNSGYEHVKLEFNNKLTPPYFPTIGDYTFLSWDEK